MSPESLSSELGQRRGAAAGTTAERPTRAEDDAREACDEGAAGSGGEQAAQAVGVRDDAGKDRRSKRKRRKNNGGTGGSGTMPPVSGSGGSAPVDPGEEEPDTEEPTEEPDPGTPTPSFRPAPGLSWQIQLTGDIDTSVNAKVFDLDLFETSAADIAALHAQGRKVICYFDTAYESYRPDSKQLEPYRGNAIKGWPGQYWLDIREPAVLDVMKARIELAQSKGCDAVDADDVDSRSNNPGFPITAADQRSFVTQLSAAAHARGLAFGLKNALEDLAALQDVVDFAVNEECFQYDECDLLTPLIKAGKAVFQIEYANGSLQSRADEVCERANALGFDTIIKRLDLDAARLSCR